ncbi:hypothetical protein [Clostridium haemolyticum]|uniref:Phage protein n=1 Tax=Clostridium haemolyticum NCTC 9693 TaxID=1443114 RepID=A0ABR4TID0_CLOHA|nr:hypothetical protein [Clostridium haemolyticum]KEI18277.1 hypothetical protein Z960_03960 [Clostridium haemolyticum NCTC 9693]KGN04201.1 hypothetical protein Z961_04435 [Clostridium haemolyticum NCTC 8350]
MIKLGDRVICPYNKKGIIEGFLSPTDVFVRVEEYDYKIKKSKVEKTTKYRINVYDIKLLKGDKEN